MLLQLAAILSVVLGNVSPYVDLVFLIFLLSSSHWLYSSASKSSAAFFASCLLIFLAKIFRSAYAEVSPLVSAIYFRNGRRRTAFLDVQFRVFFNFASLPAAVRRRTSVVGRRIFSLLPAKVRSISFMTKVWSLKGYCQVKGGDHFAKGTCSQRTRARTLPGSPQV